MPLHDSPVTIGDVYTEVQSNLYEAGLRNTTSQNILDGITDAYRKVNAELGPITRSILIPKLGSPYYNLGTMVPDYMYLVGIFNCTTNRWLEPLPAQLFKRDRLNFFTIGEPQFFNIVDLRRVNIWPYPSNPSGALFLVYKAIPPNTKSDSVPILPHSIGSQFLEYFTTAEMFEQAREFTKSQVWWDRIYKRISTQTSIYEQLEREISGLARFDQDSVLEPYRWIFHGGGISSMWISNEIPSGTVDGSNDTFQLAGTPNPTASLILTVNGQVMLQGEAYVLSGQSVVFATNYIPQTGDFIRAWYQV